MVISDLPRYAEVALPLGLHKTLHYALPPRLQEDAVPGKRVLVPLGQRVVTGYLVGLLDRVERTELKEVQEILDPEPLLDTHLLELTHRVAEYYFAPWGEVIRTTLPPGIDASPRRLVRLTAEGGQSLRTGELSGKEREILHLIPRDTSVPLHRITRGRGTSVRRLLERLQGQGLLELQTVLTPPKVRTKQEQLFRLLLSAEEVEQAIATLKVRAPRQAELLTHLHRAGGTLRAREVRAIAESPSAIAALTQKGFIKPVLSEVLRDPLRDVPVTPSEPLTLTPSQREALRQIEAAVASGEFAPFLLFGVTGSGKTEIYLRAVESVVSKGRQALVLVPEIGLIPRTAARFRARFGERVALVHSALSPGERLDQWLRIRRGEADIVIGARSAVFAPLSRLGIGVIDEEHDPAYKQEETPRYHGRDVALLRCQILGCPILLGSATPSLESFYAAETGRYRLLPLPERIGEGRLPKVTVVDLREEPKVPRRRPLFSQTLQDRIVERLNRGEQTLLLLNRRGYATTLLCRDCGAIIRCPHCSVSLILHRTLNLLRCHHCDYQERPPDHCAVCNSSDIRQLGVGTEQVEREVRSLFPSARVARMDRDTTMGRQAHHLLLSQLEGKSLDILVGTQMIAKGHDFPNVTLVGIILADVGLNLPDFRAGERTFTLLTQMVGRSGRGPLPGEAVIQTYNPEHYCIQAALAQDYLAFYHQELALRRTHHLPPFTHLIRLVVSSPKESVAAEAAEELRRLLQRDAPPLEIDGPAPAPLSRLRGRFRWHLMVKDPREELLRQKVAGALEAFQAPRGGSTRVEIDMDPADTL
jgi:primosomal protein N' (replication factor Y)